MKTVVPQETSGRVVVGERRGQVTVGVDLGAQEVGLLLDALDGAGTGDPSQRRLVLAGQLHQGGG